MYGFDALCGVGFWVRARSGPRSVFYEYGSRIAAPGVESVGL